MESMQHNASASGSSGQAGSIGMARWKLILGGLFFFLLTAGIFWHQFQQIQACDARPRWDQLRWGYLLLILLCLPVETACAALRVWLLCRVLHPGVRLWTCVKAELTNVTISMLTPSQTGGGPAQIYMLSRAGVSVGTSLTISLISFMGTMVILVLMGVYSAFLSGAGELTPLFMTAFWTVVIVMLAMIGGALSPNLLRILLRRASRTIWRLRGRRGALHDWWPPDSNRTGPPADRMGPVACKFVDLVYTYRDDVRRFLRQGKAAFAWVCVLSSAFLFSRTLMAYLCLRFLGIEASTFGQIVELQMVVIFLVFFAPTPGSAGLAEGASMAIMSAIVPVGFAPYYNLLWRFSTAYMAALGGLFYLLHAIAQDLKKRVRRPQKIEPTARDFKFNISRPADQSRDSLEVTQ